MIDLRLLLGVGLDVLGNFLSGAKGVSQTFLVLTMLVEQTFHAHQFLSQAIDFEQRCFVLLGDLVEKGRHLGTIEPTERRAKSLLT